MNSQKKNDRRSTLEVDYYLVVWTEIVMKIVYIPLKYLAYNLNIESGVVDALLITKIKTLITIFENIFDK